MVEEHTTDSIKNQPVKPTEPAQSGDPGYGLGIAGFIVSFFFGIAGLVMSIIALNQSKQAGKKNGFALAGMIIGVVKTALEALAILGLVFGSIFLINYCSKNPNECRDTSNSYNSHSEYQQSPMTSPDKTY